MRFVELALQRGFARLAKLCAARPVLVSTLTLLVLTALGFGRGLLVHYYSAQRYTLSCGLHSSRYSAQRTHFLVRYDGWSQSVGDKSGSG